MLTKWGKEFTVTSASSAQSQTVTATTAITPIQYNVSPICSTSVKHIEPSIRVAATLSNNVITISGSPAETATGTFNYSLTVSGSTTTQIVAGVILTVSAPVANIYFENGTCMCPNAEVGDTATIGRIVYTVVDNSTIATQISNGNVNLCTTKVTSMYRTFYNNLILILILAFGIHQMLLPWKRCFIPIYQMGYLIRTLVYRIPLGLLI